MKVRIIKELTSYMLPFIILLVFIESFVPVVIWVNFSIKLKQTVAKDIARTVADTFSAHLIKDKHLWKYNTIKLLEHLEKLHFDKFGHLAIIITDLKGAPIPLPPSSSYNKDREKKAIWISSPIFFEDGEKIGYVWVGIDSLPIIRSAKRLFLVLLTIGSLLGLVLYYIPYKKLSQTETELNRVICELEDSKKELELLNKNLNSKVEEKTKEIKEAYKQLESKKKRIRELAIKYQKIQNDISKHIARELHDSIGQLLTGIRLKLHLLSIEQREVVLKEVVSLIDQALDEIRTTLTILRPPLLDEMGLENAIKRIIQRLESQNNLRVDFCWDLKNKLPDFIETHLYRIIQEALTNIERHAQASYVKINVKSINSTINILIEDNGIGIENPQDILIEAEKQNKYGLIGIKERVELLDGELKIESKRGKGTILEITLSI